MDTGVALITLNAGISGMKARPWNSDVNSMRHFIGDVIKSSRGILFPIIVGSLRFWILDDFDYQEHSSEWGIHWNFYTTVAMITLAQNFIVQPKYAMAIGVIIVFTY